MSGDGQDPQVPEKDTVIDYDDGDPVVYCPGKGMKGGGEVMEGVSGKGGGAGTAPARGRLDADGIPIKAPPCVRSKWIQPPPRPASGGGANNGAIADAPEGEAEVEASEAAVDGGNAEAVEVEPPPWASALSAMEVARRACGYPPGSRALSRGCS